MTYIDNLNNLSSNKNLKEEIELLLFVAEKYYNDILFNINHLRFISFGFCFPLISGT